MRGSDLEVWGKFKVFGKTSHRGGRPVRQRLADGADKIARFWVLFEFSGGVLKLG